MPRTQKRGYSGLLLIHDQLRGTCRVQAGLVCFSDLQLCRHHDPRAVRALQSRWAHFPRFVGESDLLVALAASYNPVAMLDVPPPCSRTSNDTAVFCVT
jgi:hypothetical protein